MKILKKESPDISFSSANLSDFYFPGRGFIASLILHAAVFIGSIFIPLFWLYLFPPSGPERVVFIELNDTTTVMYLPPLQSGKQTAPEGEENEGNESPAPPSALEGLAYSGPQPILSDPPDPTNDIQTILQPEIENPEILEPLQPVPNVLQTESTPPVVQEPPEPILKMDLAPLQRMDVPDRALISPDLPAEGLNPGTQLPAAEMPDLIKADTGPEMVLPESELIRPERMNPSDQDLASTASPVLNSAPNNDFPAAQLPALIRSASGSKMKPPEADLTPLERMNPSDQDLASTASPVLNSAPNTDLPAEQLPAQIRAGAGPKMKLPEADLTPLERMNPSDQDLASTASPALNPAPNTGFQAAQLPAQIRASTGPKMKLPEFELTSPQRINAPKQAIAPTLSPLSVPNPETAVPPARIPGQIRSAGEPETPLLDSQLTPLQRRVTSKQAIATGEDQLLALTPIPAIPHQKEVVIFEGIARGSFAISPKSNLETPKMEAGSKPKDISEENNSPAANPVDGKPGVKTDTGTGEDPFVVFTNTGAGYKPNEDSASGPGEDVFEGITIVEGRYEPRDDLHIKGAGPEDDSIADISVTGGAWEPGDAPDPVSVIPTPQPLQTFFDLYVISTPNSGSQLLSYGFCEDRQTYTGFLDMRQSEDEQDHPWTLEFCLHAESGSILAVDEEHLKEGFLPPFPKEKKRPNFPEVLIRQHLDETIIIKGIVDTEGRLKEPYSMIATQNLLESRAVDTLSTWVFRPAKLYGKPVEVQVLIGIPLWLPEDVSK